MTSLLDELREEYAAELREATKVIAVPRRTLPPSRWTKGIRCRPPAEPERLAPVMAAARSMGGPTSDQALQLIIDCCDEVVANRGTSEAEDWQPIDPDGGALRFDGGDSRWKDLFGSDVENARQCVAKLLCLEAQPGVHFNIADILIDWLQGIDLQAMARVEGNSNGGAKTSPTPPASTPTGSTG